MSIARENTAGTAGTDSLARNFLKGLAGEMAHCLSTDRAQVRFAAGEERSVLTPSCIRLPLVSASGTELEFLPDEGKEPFTAPQLGFAAALGAFADILLGQLGELARMRGENAGLRREKELMEKYSSIGRMAVELARTIAAPLSAARVRAEALLSSVSGEKQARYLGEIATGLARIEKITNRLLRDAPPDPPGSGVDPVRLLDESIDVLKLQAERHVTVTRDYEPGLPPVPDRGLEHVFMNLIKNAVEAMPKGGTLSIRAARDPCGIVVSFADTGTGIPPAFRERIFEPFFTTKESNGSGLGLWISKEIITACGGRIEVTSLPGKGSRFTVFLPSAAVAA